MTTDPRQVWIILYLYRLGYTPQSRLFYNALKFQSIYAPPSGMIPASFVVQQD